MAHTSERAVAILHAHSNIPTTTKAAIAGVTKNDGNQGTLEYARRLLMRFPEAVQRAATSLELEDSEEARLSKDVAVQSLKKHNDGLQRDNSELAADNSGLQRDNAGLQREVADLEKYNADLKKNISALAADVENSDPNLAESIASAAALNEKAAKVEVKREPGEEEKEGGGEGPSPSKKAKV